MTSGKTRSSGFIRLGEGGFNRPEIFKAPRKLLECDDRKLGVIISAFQFLPPIVRLKQERGDRGESVGVITGLVFVKTSVSCGDGGGLLEGSRLHFSGWCSLVAPCFFFYLFIFKTTFTFFFWLEPPRKGHGALLDGGKKEDVCGLLLSYLPADRCNKRNLLFPPCEGAETFSEAEKEDCSTGVVLGGIWLLVLT